MKNNLFKKIVGVALGFGMLAGVGAGLIQNKGQRVDAAKKDWTQVKSISDLNDSNYFILTDKNADKTDPAIYFNGTVSSGHFKSTAFSDTNPANTSAAGIVQFIKVSENVYKIKELTTGKFLIATKAASGNGSLADSDSNGWYFLNTSGNFDAIYQTAFSSKYAALRAYGTTDFRTYSNDTSSNEVKATSGTSFHIFKYEYKEDVAVTGVSLDVTEKTLLTGESFDLTATIAPNNATDQTVAWSSSNAEVATVENGHVEALSVGETNITVTTTDGNFTATCKVTVNKNTFDYDTLTSSLFTATSTSYTAFSGKKSISKAVYAGSTNKQTTGAFAIRKDKSDTGIYTTATGGLIKSITVNRASGSSATSTYCLYAKNEPYTAISDLYDTNKLGTALMDPSDKSTVITLDSDYQYFALISTNGTSQFDSVIVKWEPVKPTSITLAATTSTTVTIGNTETIVPTLVNDDYIISENELTWSSSNTGVATVENGVVTAVSAGQTTITAALTADDKIKATIDITVSAEVVHVESVSVNPTTLNMLDGEQETLTATVLPANAGDKSVSWSSDNTGVATVEDGVVTAVSAGTATITVTTTDAGKTATCVVTVTMRVKNSYELVTNNSQLVIGAKYIVVGIKENTYYAMGHYVSGNNIKPFEIPTPTNNIFTDYETTLNNYAYVLGGTAGAYTFFDGTNWIYAAGNTSSSNNHLKATNSLQGDNSKFAISIAADSNQATIEAISTTTVNKLVRFNTGSNLFSCYLNNTKQSPVYLYRLVPQAGTAEAFATSFLDQTGAICSTTGTHGTALEEIWSGLEELYNGLGNEEKAKLIAGDASELIKAAIERYDYLVGAYGLEQFIENHVVSNVRAGFAINNVYNKNSVVAIVAVSLVSITSLGVLVTLKKRKAVGK